MENDYKVIHTQPDLITTVGVGLSLISILVLIVSYLNHIMFYSFFGIPISNYIQVSEAVVLFLPQLINYIIDTVLMLAIGAGIIYLLRAIYSKEQLSEDTEKPINDNFEDSLKLIDMLRTIKKYLYEIKLYAKELKISKILSNVFWLFIVLLNFLARPFIFIIGPGLLATPYYGKNDNSELTGIMTILFTYAFSIASFETLFEYTNYLIFKVKNKRLLKIIGFSKLIFYVFLVVYIQSSLTASNIKSGYADYNITFEYNNSQIKTDTNLVYIGGTQNFIFLRDRRDKKNMVFKMDKVDNYSIKKIEYRYTWFWKD
jgi:hypothetical protein